MRRDVEGWNEQGEGGGLVLRWHVVNLLGLWGGEKGLCVCVCVCVCVRSEPRQNGGSLGSARPLLEDRVTKQQHADKRGGEREVWTLEQRAK